MPETADRYQTALQAAGIGIWDNDLLEGVIYFSGFSHQLYELDPAASITLPLIYSRIHPDDRPAVKEAVQQAIDPALRAPYFIEYRILLPGSTDTARWVRSQGKAYFNEAGRAYRLTGTLQDITAEMTRREHTRKLLALMDNSIELMSILETDGRNSYLNRAGMEMLGFTGPEQVRTTPISELHAPEDIRFVEQEVLPAVMAHGRWSGRMNVRHLQSGLVFPVHNNTVRIDDPQTGQPTAIGAVMRDLRPELEAVRALEESEANFRTLVMQAPVGICIQEGEDLRFVIANDAYLLMARRIREEVIGRTLLEVFPEVEEQGFNTLLQNVMQSGETFYGKEFEVVLEVNGQPVTGWYDFTYQPLRHADGQITRVMTLAIDVSDKVLARRKLQESEEELQRRVAGRTAELERKNRELEEFTYVSSHDLQEPLRKILIFTDGIRQREWEALSPYARERFEKISASALRMSESLKALLNYAAQGEESAPAPADLNGILEGVLADLERLIEEKGARITAEPLPVLPCVAQRVQQLLYNLLHNALKFSRPGVPPEIAIRCRREENTWIIQVQDNGIGFPQEKAERIFGLFQRLHGRQEYAGTGIGLSLCQKIVQGMGGRLTARSEEGSGACFTMELPATSN